jgi:hypothetical protein
LKKLFEKSIFKNQANVNNCPEEKTRPIWSSSAQRKYDEKTKRKTKRSLVHNLARVIKEKSLLEFAQNLNRSIGHGVGTR